MQTTIFTTAMALALVLTLAVVSGCASRTADEIDMGAYDYRERYPLGVTSELVTAEFSGDGGTMSADARRQLDGFVTAYLREGEAPITILTRGNEESALIDEIVASAVAMGLARSEFRRSASPTITNGDVVLSFVNYRVVYPECGSWLEDNKYTNENSYNFGCSTQHNLGLMIANPHDLVEPREMTPRYPARTVGVVQSLGTGDDPTSAEVVGDESIVDVGN